MKLIDALDCSPDLLVLFDRLTLQVLDARGKTESLTAADVRGKSMATVVAGGSAELFERCLARRHDPHPDVPLRVQVRDDEGHESPADIRLGEAAPGVVMAVVRHVSQRARVAERELISVTCAVPVAILTWGFDGALVSCNPAGERLYGIDGAALGQPVSQLMSAAAWQEIQLLQQRLLAGETLEPREVSRLKRAGGESFQVEVEETLFLMRDVAGHPVRFGSYSREATELVRLRAATQALSRSPEAAATEPAPGPMRAVLEASDVAAADGRVTVLLLGETGVGKSRLARRIHARGPRASGPFLELNCAGLEPQLLESELFGHERGAFTGAMRTKRGLVEAAAGGTLLLDEVGELPPGVQAKLLTFLDERTFRRVGGEALLKADVRLIAATNSDLAARVEDGTFRKDLFYRLNVLPLTLPPLRERREELPALARAIAGELKPGATLSQEATAALVRHSWPGNLRELRNVLERALLNGGGRIEVSHLPVELRLGESELAIDERLRSASRRHIEQVLDAAGGNRSAAAQILGISRSTLRRRLRN